ncbi:hypothetical protein DSO57_1032163 [Entomophthora muscae]|uniref:Uncharacterized protein n=1 Tax=Entomophthora muscae TaxID=34485 RepID=A0ACC2SQ29_9FUNG|nr:hypothetical protein DSO57_1032163 [Entomophthora muscae]
MIIYLFSFLFKTPLVNSKAVNASGHLPGLKISCGSPRTSKTLVYSLTCNNVEFALPTEAPIIHMYEDSCLPSSESVVLSPINSMRPTPEVLPRCTSWLVLGVLLMGLNMYLPQLSPVGFFWSPV